MEKRRAWQEKRQVYFQSQNQKNMMAQDKFQKNIKDYQERVLNQELATKQLKLYTRDLEQEESHYIKRVSQTINKEQATRNKLVETVA